MSCPNFFIFYNPGIFRSVSRKPFSAAMEHRLREPREALLFHRAYFPVKRKGRREADDLTHPLCSSPFLCSCSSGSFLQIKLIGFDFERMYGNFHGISFHSLSAVMLQQVAGHNLLHREL